MPWHVEKRNDEYCVIQDSDNSTVACHKTEDGAEAQRRALYVAESKVSGVEIDALKSSWGDSAAFTTHTHAPLKSFIATPRADPTLRERFRSLFKSELKPGQYMTKGADGLRYLLSFTSNSYQDRDDEIITSKALSAYEASCYPGEDLFHCDNPYLWWHDDDVPMGEIVAVNYSTPFLVEIAKELNTPTARILWDFAEKNGDKAGASHRFGYRDEDRLPDGTYDQIVKQESSYLPDRNLAANIMTYAGVIDKNMATAQSDARLNEIFSAATGGKIQDAAAKIHAKSGELDKELAKLGIMHKAKAEGDKPEDEPKLDEEGNPIPAEEKEEVTLPSDFMAKLQQLEAIYQMMMDMVSAQSGMMGEMETGMEREAALVKQIKSFQDALATKEKAHDALMKRVELLEARLKMTPRKASTDPETTLTVAELRSLQEKAEAASITRDPMFGVEVDPSKNPFKKL